MGGAILFFFFGQTAAPITGPCVVESAVYLPGMKSGEVYLPGAVQSAEYLPGCKESETSC